MKIIPAFVKCFFHGHQDLKLNHWQKKCNRCKGHWVLDIKNNWVKIKPMTKAFAPVNDREV